MYVLHLNTDGRGCCSLALRETTGNVSHHFPVGRQAAETAVCRWGAPGSTSTEEKQLLPEPQLSCESPELLAPLLTPGHLGEDFIP
ncbi:hypothetical protein GN956_G26159 [Arapaima gigas]